MNTFMIYRVLHFIKDIFSKLTQEFFIYWSKPQDRLRIFYPLSSRDYFVDIFFPESPNLTNIRALNLILKRARKEDRPLTRAQMDFDVHKPIVRFSSRV